MIVLHGIIRLDLENMSLVSKFVSVFVVINLLRLALVETDIDI